jgi:HD-like signal output (HDOD) protein
MKDETWMKRQFLLSSFSRNKILIQSDVYRFVDKIIHENWNYPSDLSELDCFIHNEYEKYKNG